jgi:nitrate/nitrite transport system substrate-binding protein
MTIRARTSVCAPPRPSRREVVKGAAGTVALIAAAKACFPFGVHIANAAGPETTKAALGYIALMDASVLVIAKEMGLFAKHGMPDVEVVKQASWAAARDNIVLGGDRNGIDGAHILTPMPYMISTGKVTQNNVPVPMAILARLHLDGQSISVSNEFKEPRIGLDASLLKPAIAARKAQGRDFVGAHTFPGGTHDLWLRYWLAAGGIDPDNDVKVIPVPPPQMVANMKVGNVDAFCVAEPWHGQLINQGLGYTALTTDELWPLHPDKSFAMRADWIEKHPRSALALLMAIFEAQRWCDKAENKQELAAIVSKRQWFNVPIGDIVGRLSGEFDLGHGRKVSSAAKMMKFWSYHASYPFKSHDLWFLVENTRWGKLDPNLDRQALVQRVNREDLWRDAANALGIAAAEIPASTSRGKEVFFDGKIFDPDNPGAYLESVAIKRGSA